MRIVLDTNVIVAALLNPLGAPASALNTFLNGQATLLIDERIAMEYRDVLNRPKFRFESTYTESLLDLIVRSSEKITASPTRVEMQDPDDVAFFEVATAGNADFLITGNLRHFPMDPIIVTPAEFITRIREAE